jgi:hypothetical protein
VAAAIPGAIALQNVTAGSPAGPLPETEKALTAAAAVPPPSASAATQSTGEATIEHVANVPGLTGGHAVVEGDRLYVGAYGFGLRIFDISDPAIPAPIGQYVPGPQSAEDPGARADAVPDAAVFDGRHIVALGGTRRAASTTQTEFIDATDPENPVLLWRFMGPDDGEAHNSDIVDPRRLWLPSGGSGINGLRIYDLSPLLGETPEAPVNLARHDPVALWEDSPHRGDREVGPAFTHVHDVEVYVDHEVDVPDGNGGTTTELRDIAFVAEGGSYLEDGNTGSIFVVDITAPAHPVVLNRWLHPHAEGHHPIRYFHEVQLLDGDPSVMIVTDEDLHNGCDAGGVTFVRVSRDLTRAEELTEWFIGTGTPAAVCSVHVFSTHGNHMFIGSYNAGLQVVDVSDPTQPQKTAELIPPGANYWGALWHDGYIYAGDFGARGLDVFRFTPAS